MKKISDYKHLVFFDLETTGLNYQKEDIIEFGAVVVNQQDNHYEVISEYNHIVHTDKPVSETITTITGITQSMVDAGVNNFKIYEIMKDIFKKDTLVIAYNIQFDISFVYALMKRYDQSFTVDFDILDMLSVYKDYYPYPHRLADAITTLDVPFENTHRALDDVIATVEVFKIMHQKEDLSPFINQIGYNPKFGLNGMKFSHVRYYEHPYKIGSLKAKIKQIL